MKELENFQVQRTVSHLRNDKDSMGRTRNDILIPVGLNNGWVNVSMQRGVYTSSVVLESRRRVVGDVNWLQRLLEKV